MSAQQLFDELKRSGMVGATGHTYFELNGLKTLVRDSSIVGNVIQEWLKSFMDSKGIAYRLKANSQEFPDFLMHGNNDMADLLEVKCFKKSPNFDVANFMAYCRSLTTHPHRLDADYLIFEYEENATGIAIKNIWLKKVWEICSASERSVLKIQWKQGVAFNIRPATWYAKKPKYPSFNTRLEFVQAIKKVLDTSATSAGLQKGWFATVSGEYKLQTGHDL
jgi:NgoBV restriction endonuclease